MSLHNGLTGSDLHVGPTIKKNTATTVGARRNLNFIEGSNVTLTLTDDSVNDEIEITIASTGGGGGGLTQDQVLNLASFRA